MKQKKYNVIGLMSGTSLDGLDIAFCEFKFTAHWEFIIKAAETIRYSPTWKEKLSTAHHLSAEGLLALHAEYGTWLGKSVTRFIRSRQLSKVDLVASHGHTIFHQPENGFTFQLGSGMALHAATNLPVAFDFRSLDVARGGEGAPLVPMGDQLLFSNYDVCINLGGIANLSMMEKGERRAFDICFCNMGLNFLAGMKGLEFDKDGKMASGGNSNEALARRLMEVYRPMHKKRPSLGREIFEREIEPLLAGKSVSVGDKLATFTQSIAHEIAAAVPSGKRKILCTGGGALNGFLMERIRNSFGARAEIHRPDPQIIAFKEALVFALLGVLRLRNEINVLRSVTHASSDSSSGQLIGA